MEFVIDLEKSARSHKYIKREGGPGNYKYFYKLPDGRIVASDSPEAAEHGISHDGAKLEHAKRLIASKMSTRTDISGLHNMSNKQIAEHVGMDSSKVSTAANNMKRATRGEWQGRTFQAHDFEDHHMKEAVHSDPRNADYPDSEATTATPATPSTPAPRRGGAAIPPAAGVTRPTTVTTSTPATVSTPAPRTTTSGVPGDRPRRSRRTATPEATPSTTRSTRGDRTVAAETAAPTPADNIVARAAEADARDGRIAERAAKAAEEAKAAKVAELRRKLAEEHGITLPSATPPAEAAGNAVRAANESVEQDRQRAIEAAARASSPTAPHAQELHEASPELAQADAPVQRQEAVAAAGGNPYLSRAKEIFERIKGEVKPERAESAKYLLQTVPAAGADGKIDKAEWKKAFKEATGRGDFSKAISDLEAATFVDADEIMENKPFNPEVERMKRGFAMKQFNRMKPYLNDAYKAKLSELGRSGPPPYPTYGDLKSWAEHGTPRSEGMSWTTPTGRPGGVTKAQPQEFFDSMPKGADGKPMNPPDWLPLHLTPVWSYVAKSASKRGKSPYEEGAAAPAGQEYSKTESSFSYPSQGQLAGHLHNSIRRYVQMRGENNFVDIPDSKLTDLGLSHHDIYKAVGKKLGSLLLTKIVDPVALMPFIKEEMSKSVKKSFSLVIEANQKPVSFTKSFVVSLSKSEARRAALIDDIKRLRGSL